MGDVMPPETSAEETYIAIDGAIPPPETETACDLPLAGVPVQETEEPVMGDVVWEGEVIEEITEEATEEVTDEETTEPEIMDIMGEPAE